MRRLLPAPILSAALFVLWLLFAQSVTRGGSALGAVLALVVPVLTRGLRPTPVRMRRPLVAARLVLRVLGDATRSNARVGWAILTRRPTDLASRFVHVPLDVRDPNALAVLAIIVTATPGTAWAELAADRSELLIHVLDEPDEAEVIATIKRRYEAPLMEIFE